MKYVIVISKIMRLYSLSFINSKGQFSYYNVAVYILVQSEEKYALIQKEIPLTIQIDKGKS